MENLIRKAYEFAIKKHDGQYFNDGSGTPYIEHCKRVFKTLFTVLPNNVKNKEVLGATAFLHDVIEDTETTYKELENEFGDEIARNVLALSKNKNLPREERMGDSIERILMTSKEAQMVKLADRITNIDHLHPVWSYSKSMEYLEESIQIRDRLGSCNEALCHVLEQKITDYYQAIQDKFGANENTIK